MKNQKNKFSFRMLLAFLSILSFISSTKAAGLKGAYTINPGSTATAKNYTSFNDADSDMIYGSRANGATANGPAVSAAVTFTVSAGTYIEDVHIPAISGASAKNTISFVSASTDSTKVIISSSSTGSYFSPAAVLHLDSASYINFSRITFQRTSGSYYDHVVMVDNFSNYNSFTNCQMLGCYTPGSLTSYCMLVYSGLVNLKGYTQDQYNTFRNNYMKDGYDGIYWTGALNSGSAERGNIFDHNIIDSCGYNGLILVSQDNPTVTSNDIRMPNGNIGIYTAYINDVTLGKHGPCLIANNFVSVGNSTLSNGNIAMYLLYIDSANIVFNNTNVYGGSIYGSAAANITPPSASNSINVYNNNFINQNSTAADIAFSASYLNDINYNNVYSASGSLVSYNGTSYRTLANWKASGSGLGLKDTSIDPLYNSNYDLHINAPGLNNSATPLSYVTVDFDNEKRDAKTPDIGADEFSPAALFPACMKILNPETGFCVGKQDVKILLYNKGTDTLKSVSIEWSVNGTTQSTYSWTGILPSGTSKVITLGTYNFSSATASYTISSYPSLANGTSVSASGSNTANIVARSGITGAFTIDPKGSGSTNYISFRDAVNDLNEKGVCGASTFTVADGTYNESIEIKTIPGASSVNTVTFQSKSKDSTKVILDSSWGSYNYYTKGYTLKLNGADWVRFNQMTIVNHPASIFQYGDAVLIAGAADHNTFSNCVIAVNTTNNTDYGNPVFFDVYSINEFNTFNNNIISGGYYSILCWPLVGYEKGNVFTGNNIDSCIYIAAYMGYQDSFTFSNNKLSTEVGNLCLQLYYITGNASKGDSSMVCNNFIDFKPKVGAAVISYFCDKLNFYNNSIVSNCPYAGYNEVTFYSYPAATFNLVNNIIYNNAGGVLFELNNYGVSYSDYNDWYSSGSNYGTWNSTICSSLADLQAANSMEAHSISSDPHFKSLTSNDLHLTSLSYSLVQKGIKRPNNPIDIDNELRSTSPTIGADEIRVFSNDAAIISVDSPATVFCATTRNIYVKLFNAGSNTLSSATINWSVDGKSMTSYSWKGSLAKFSSALVKIGSLSFTTNTEKRIKSWSSKPNGAIDSNTLNDTTISRKSMGIKGTFTIGGVSPDYANFRDAAFAMNNFGVCGSVVFNVRNGYYNESISLDSIAGASSSNTVIFQSASLDPAGVNLDTTWSVTGAYPGGSTGLLGHTIQLYGATYITFQYLTISNFGAGNNGFANVVELTKRASHNTFDHDILLADTNTTAADYGAVIYNDPASSENFNTFSNSLISGNKYGFYFYDYYPAVETGNIIHGNTILNSKCGINAWYQDSLIIEHNKIFLYLNTFSAINLYYIAQNGTGGDSSLVANNMITTFNSDTSSLYIYDYNARINVYNNSIYSSPNSSNNFTVYALNYYAGLGGIVRLMNNVVENDNSGPVLFSAYSNNYSDYNDWYSTGSLLTSWDGTLCADLSTLQSTSGMDAHSINADPVYNDISTGNLHATTSSTNIDGKGTPLNCIKDDIDGQSRNKTTPDMGADEFNTFKDDIGVSAISIPGNICGSKNTIRAVKLHNYGINDQTKFNISVDAIKGAKGSAKLAFTGTLKADSDAIVNISFSPALDTRAGGSFTFKAYTDLTADKDRTNDTTVSILSFKTSPVANFSITNGCPGDTAKLSDASAAGAGTLSSYTWDFGSGNKSTGSKTTFVFSKGKANIVYAVTNSSGCSDTLRKTITIAHPDSSFLLNISADGTVTFSANNTSLAKYTWDFGDKSASGNGNPVIHKYKIGRYTASLIATDSNGCSSNDTSSFSILTSGIGVQEQFENFSLSIYPNPFSESANIHYSLASDVNVKISIYDFTGKLIAKLKDQRENAGEHIIRFSPSESASINAGTYLVRIIIGNQVLNKTITFVR